MIPNFCGLMVYYEKTLALSLTDKISAAAKSYLTRYGKTPDTCYVHPTMLSQGTPTIPTIAVLPSISVLPNNYWIGVQNHA